MTGVAVGLGLGLGTDGVAVIGSPPQAAVWVDDDYTGAAGSTVSRPGGTATIGLDAFATIAAGLAHVTPTGTVTVLDGSYATENFTVPAGVTVAMANNAALGNTSKVATGDITDNGFVSIPTGLTVTSGNLTVGGGGQYSLTGTQTLTGSVTTAGYVEIVNGGSLTAAAASANAATGGSINLGYRKPPGGTAGTQGTGTLATGKNDVTITGAILNNNGLLQGTNTGSGKSATSPHLFVAAGSLYYRGDGTVRTSQITITVTGGTDVASGFSG